MTEYQEGDLVEAVKDDTKITGRVVDNSFGLRLYGTGWALDTLKGRGFTLTVLKKAAPPLPTEVGWYLDRWGGAVYLGLDGSWMTALKYGAPVEDVQARTPLTRIEPVPVTVQKVIDYLVNERGFDPNGFHIPLVREHFGVVS